MVDREPTRSELYARGLDGSIFRRVGNVQAVPETWQGWQGLGGYSQGRPAVVSQNAAQLMVFIRGSDNQLYANRLTVNTWTGWQSLGGSLTADPVAVAHGNSSGTMVSVFVRGAGGDVQYRRWNASSWEGWTSLGGWITLDLSAVARDTTKIYVFVRGGDNQLWLAYFDGGSWGWQGLGGVLTSDPVAAPYKYVPGQSAPYDNRVIVAGRGTDNGMHINSAQTGQPFGGWRGLSGLTSLPVTIATAASGYHAFAIDAAGTVHHRTGQY